MMAPSEGDLTRANSTTKGITPSVGGLSTKMTWQKSNVSRGGGHPLTKYSFGHNGLMVVDQPVKHFRVRVCIVSE